MKGFISFSQEIKALLEMIVCSNSLHSKWLNTLSYLENCGARKIAFCEHPTLVKEEMLKHAAEEFRHAHYLKRQIQKVSSEEMEDYSLSNMLGRISSLNYLNELDVQTSRYLSHKGFIKEEIKEKAYLLVTYAIESRASELYPIYDEILRKNRSPVTVKSILLEEKEHLKEMEEGLQQLKHGWEYAKDICQIEGKLCQKWLQAISYSKANKEKS
jgi:hypothetical protein